MPVGLTASARGANDFARVAKQLRQAGTDGKELRKELYRGINRAVKPLTLNVRLEAPQFLPDAYAVELAKTLRIKTRRRAGQNPAIYLVATAKTKRGKQRRLDALNRGRLRHPLWGDRRHWYDQPIQAGWWTRPLDEGAPRVRRELMEVIDRIDRQLSRG